MPTLGATRSGNWRTIALAFTVSCCALRMVALRFEPFARAVRISLTAYLRFNEVRMDVTECLHCKLIGTTWADRDEGITGVGCVHKSVTGQDTTTIFFAGALLLLGKEPSAFICASAGHLAWQHPEASVCHAALRRTEKVLGRIPSSKFVFLFLGFWFLVTSNITFSNSSFRFSSGFSCIWIWHRMMLPSSSSSWSCTPCISVHVIGAQTAIEAASIGNKFVSSDHCPERNMAKHGNTMHVERVAGYVCLEKSMLVCDWLNL